MRTASLGILEKQVMDIVWKLGNCSTREVLLRLKSDKKLAYTTVATILQRLYDKGLLSRKEEKTGYSYSPKLSKEVYSKSVAKSFLTNFISSFGDIAIASFAESVDKLPEKKRKYFLEILEGHDKS